MQLGELFLSPEFMLDHIAATANSLFESAESHFQVVALSGGLLFCLTGYFGLHWIERRRFYRRKLADPFSTYAKAWCTKFLEGNLQWLFLLMASVRLRDALRWHHRFH